MYNVDLAGKIAVVTGGSRGIGMHIAEALHDSGARVAITGRHEESLRETAEEIGDGCRSYVCDQRDPKAVRAFAESVNRDMGVPHILVNNAANGVFGVAVADISYDDWSRTLDTNLTGVFLVTQAFLPGMIERASGDIFMIGSTSGKRGDPGAAAYAASKFGLQGFAQSLLYEVRRHNIRVSVINPSAVSSGPDIDPTEGPGVRPHAADIAATIVHLCGVPRRTLFREVEIWGTNP